MLARRVADIADVSRCRRVIGYPPDTATAMRSFSPTGSASRCWWKALPMAKTRRWRAPWRRPSIRLGPPQRGRRRRRALYEWNYAKQILRIQAGSQRRAAANRCVPAKSSSLQRPLPTAIRRTGAHAAMKNRQADIEIEGACAVVRSRRPSSNRTLTHPRRSCC